MQAAKQLTGQTFGRLTVIQRAGSHTGRVSWLCNSDVHKKAEELLGRPVFTHKMGNPEIWEELRRKVMPEFLAICYTGEEHD